MPRSIRNNKEEKEAEPQGQALPKKGNNLLVSYVMSLLGDGTYQALRFVKW